MSSCPAPDAVAGAPLDTSALGLSHLQTPQEVGSYQAALAAAAPSVRDPEQQMANKILANSLRAKSEGLRARATETAGDGAAGGMTMGQRIQLAGFRQRGAIAAAEAADRKAGLKRQDAAEARATNADYREALIDAEKTGQAGSVIVSRIPSGMSPDKALEFFNTPEGRSVSQDAIASLRKSAADTTLPSEWGDTAAAPKLTFGDTSFDRAGQFDSFLNDGENEYPRDGGWFRSGKYDEHCWARSRRRTCAYCAIATLRPTQRNTRRRRSRYSRRRRGYAAERARFFAKAGA